MGRATQGVKLIDLAKRGDTIASVCKVSAYVEEVNEEEGLSAENADSPSEEAPAGVENENSEEKSEN